jgi:hypothetical protein
MHRELFHQNMGEMARRRPTGIRSYGRSWQRPGGDAGPLACSASANSNVLAGSWLGEVRAAARSLVYRRENLKVVSFATNSRAIMAIWAAGAGALSRPALAGPAGKSFTIILTISGIPAVGVCPQAAGRLADGCGQPR